MMMNAFSKVLDIFQKVKDNIFCPSFLSFFHKNIATSPVYLYFSVYVNKILIKFKTNHREKFTNDIKRKIDKTMKLGLPGFELTGAPTGQANKVWNAFTKDDEINLGYLLGSDFAK